MQQVITNGSTSTAALEGSTEQAQFTGVMDLVLQDVSSKSRDQANGHNREAQLAMPDPSSSGTNWDASDELMPSGD